MARANEKEIGRLERRHQKLKDRVAQYETRLYLTASEQQDLAAMKKEKLATKDAMTSLRQAS